MHEFGLTCKHFLAITFLQELSQRSSNKKQDIMCFYSSEFALNQYYIFWIFSNQIF